MYIEYGWSRGGIYTKGSWKFPLQNLDINLSNFHFQVGAKLKCSGVQTLLAPVSAIKFWTWTWKWRRRCSQFKLINFVQNLQLCAFQQVQVAELIGLFFLILNGFCSSAVAGGTCHIVSRCILTGGRHRLKFYPLNSFKFYKRKL